jgi:hypothetical protein
MKQFILLVAIAAAFGTAASACPIQIDGNAATTSHDQHASGHVSAGVTLIMQPPQTGVLKRDIQASTSGSMTVRWNSAPRPMRAAPVARARIAPALPPADRII